MAAVPLTAKMGTNVSQYGQIVLGTKAAILGGGFKGLPGIVIPTGA